MGGLSAVEMYMGFHVCTSAAIRFEVAVSERNMV